MYKLTKTPIQKGKKFLYEVKDENGKLLISRTSANRNYIAVMVCKKENNVYVPNFFFSRLDLIGKSDSRHYVKYQIGIATL